MISVTVNRVCNFSAQRAWALLSDFGNLSWVPGMGEVTTEGHGVGMTRTIALKQLPPAVESLDSLDPQAMTFSYSIVSGNPMPVAGLRGVVRVQSASESTCIIEWQALADSASIAEVEVVKLLTRFYGKTLEIVDNHLCSETA